jgi:hypothetical protein
MRYRYYMYAADEWQYVKTYRTRGGARKAAKRDGQRGYSSAIVPSYSLPDAPPLTISGPRMKRLWQTVPNEVKIYAVHA